MKTSSCFSLSNKTIALFFAGGLAAQAAGPLSFPGVAGDARGKASGDAPFESFWTDLPLAASVRVALVPTKSCETALKRVQDWRAGSAFSVGRPSWKAWEPWSPDDREAVEDCRKFPCAVKLDGDETRALTEERGGNRTAKFEDLVLARAKRYLETGKRPPYEFPGELADPWAWFRERGLQTGGKPVFEGLRLTKLDFAPGKFRPIRQVLEQKTWREGGRVTHLLRDAYTAHYFDGWGEWLEAECVKPDQLRVVQLLLMEFDLFKKTDLVSKFARPKMKQALEERSLTLLKERETLWK